MFGFGFCCLSFLLYFCQICRCAETNCTYEQVVRHKLDKDENDIGFGNESDEAIRITHWCHTDNHIQEHNSKNTSYKLTHNWLSHKTPEEMDKFNSLVDTVPLDIDDLTSETAGSKMKTARFQGAKKCVPRPPPPVTWKVPDSINWTAKGLLLAPKDQSGAVAAKHQLETGESLELSQENIIDCADDYCGGGNVIETFQYIGENGLHTDEVYPYTSYKVKEGTKKGPGCKTKKIATPPAIPPSTTKRPYVYIINTISKKKFVSVKSDECGLDNGPNEELLKQWVAKQPVYVAIYASSPDFKNYHKGIYDNPTCPKNKRNHAVLVVGYGTDKVTGLDYWIVKNSWGGWKPKKCQPDGRCIKHYGRGGYVLMRRGVAMCAIDTEAAVPL